MTISATVPRPGGRHIRLDAACGSPGDRARGAFVEASSRLPRQRFGSWRSSPQTATRSSCFVTGCSLCSMSTRSRLTSRGVSATCLPFRTTDRCARSTVRSPATNAGRSRFALLRDEAFDARERLPDFERRREMVGGAEIQRPQARIHIVRLGDHERARFAVARHPVEDPRRERVAVPEIDDHHVRVGHRQSPVQPPAGRARAVTP